MSDQTENKPAPIEEREGSIPFTLFKYMIRSTIAEYSTVHVSPIQQEEHACSCRYLAGIQQRTPRIYILLEIKEPREMQPLMNWGDHTFKMCVKEFAP